MAVEKLEIETYFGKCKCCLTYGYLRTMWEKHVVDGETEVYGQMLTQCFSISWTIQRSEDDDQICEDCIWKLREACTFKKQVLRCQKELDQSAPEDMELEVQFEPDDGNYVVEYLEEEILDDPTCDKENSDGDSCKESLDYGESDDEQSPGDDDDVLKEEDEDYGECDADKDFLPITPRKRRPPKKHDDTDSDTDAPKPKWPKKLPKEERSKTYRQYTMEMLRSAVEAVTSKKMNQKQAAKHYQVPRKTLSAKVREVKSEAENIRPLTPEPMNTQENEDVMSVLKKHRANIHSVLSYSNATPIRGYWGVGYVCAFCPDQFTSPSALKSHTLRHGNLSKLYTVPHIRTHVARLDVTDLKCCICNTKMEDLMTLMKHLKQHDKPMNFDINNHMMPFKFESEGLECAECGNQFKSFKFLSEHMSNVHYRNYICGKCDRGFVNKVNLRAHLDTHKTGNFRCDHCGKIFDTRRKKTTHERLTHALQTKKIQCGFCKMKFGNIEQKINHELRSHRRFRGNFACNACNKTFVKQRALSVHISKDHLLYRPYRCTLKGCDKAFFLNRTLKAHVLSHADARPFHCTLCTKTYRSEKSLKEHMFKHNEKKELKCPSCSRCYVLEENLARHLKEKH